MWDDEVLDSDNVWRKCDDDDDNNNEEKKSRHFHLSNDKIARAEFLNLSIYPSTKIDNFQNLRALLTEITKMLQFWSNFVKNLWYNLVWHDLPPPAKRVGSLPAGVVSLSTPGVDSEDTVIDTIDWFAQRLHISEVFTSMVITPFFLNVVEQVSAVLFAYWNEMDLCCVGDSWQCKVVSLLDCL